MKDSNPDAGHIKMKRETSLAAHGLTFMFTTNGERTRVACSQRMSRASGRAGERRSWRRLSNVAIDRRHQALVFEPARVRDPMHPPTPSGEINRCTAHTFLAL